ncbi:MAG: MFS transporter [Rhodanobacter sp. SCN 68-63]|nr:MAG: MFS transporter [Rhodanobacter sp. SCN 68-63]
MNSTVDLASSNNREVLLRVLSAATFVIFFQAFMVAPIIPQLSDALSVSPQEAGLIVPAYLIPYGMATLVYGLLADRLGLWRVMATSLAAFALLTAMTATARSVQELILWRAVTGIGASGVVPLALTLVGRLFSYEQRGRPLGWLFGAMAGGMAFGSTFGALLEPYTGWRVLFAGVGAVGAVMLTILLSQRRLITGVAQPIGGSLDALFRGYRDLLTMPRGRRTYGYVFVNSIFHSGVFTWLGLYLERRYGLGPIGIGLALLGYGLPGFVFGPLIGRAADRYGRGRLLPIGLAISAVAAAALMLDMPLMAAAFAITLLSLGYDTTQPLFAGIVTSLSSQRPGQAMGLNVFVLFVGFGIGSFVFGEMLRPGLAVALATFAAVELGLATMAIFVFRTEVPGPKQATRGG